jgi:2-oxoglutaroyl-CoA hydrolase
MHLCRNGDAEERDWGIAVACVPDADLEQASDDFVDEQRVFSPLVQPTLKQLLKRAQHTSVDASIEMEGKAYGRLHCSGDFRKGVKSCHAKCRPVFKGS